MVSLFESDEHVTRAKPPRNPSLTAAQKAFAKQMAEAGMKSARIRTAMPQHFTLQPRDLPALQKVQNFVCYYRRIKLGGSDTTASITGTILAHAFTGREEEHEPFAFGWDLDENGQLLVGNGSDAKPFLIGFTFKALLRQAARDSSQFIFHVDATYKINQVGYPVIVCGITDAARTFHLLALFVTSQQLEDHYAKSFAALRWVYSRVVGQPLLVTIVMSDADAAQYNAVTRVFGGDCNYAHLMCCYHVIAKVVERTKGMSKDMSGFVVRYVYDMHFSKTHEDFQTSLAAASKEWKDNATLQHFQKYFNRVWLNERFCRWQCFQTPPGFAKTNNPVERFNRMFKRDYTAHRLLTMGSYFAS